MLRHLICKRIQCWILQNTFVGECQKKKKIALSTIDVY